MSELRALPTQPGRSRKACRCQRRGLKPLARPAQTPAAACEPLEAGLLNSTQLRRMREQCTWTCLTLLPLRDPLSKLRLYHGN